MKKIIKSLAVLMTIVFLSSFKNTNNFIGKYGVSDADPAQIVLLINADHTFYYQDYSIASNKIAINGTWTNKRGKVILKDNQASSKLHSTWTFANNGQVAKSHKGLCFYRLCKLAQ